LSTFAKGVSKTRVECFSTHIVLCVPEKNLLLFHCITLTKIKSMSVKVPLYSNGNYLWR